MKLGGWEPDQSRVVAQACLSALKQLTLSDRQLTGMEISLCRLLLCSKLYKLGSAVKQILLCQVANHVQDRISLMHIWLRCSNELPELAIVKMHIWVV